MKRVSRFSAYQSELKKLEQTDNELGCIPTNIAAALRAYGVPHASEKLIQLAYQYAISFEKVKYGVLDKLEEMIGESVSTGFELEHQPGINSLNEWWEKVTECIDKRDSPVIFPYKANGCHVVTAIGYDDDARRDTIGQEEKLEIYDPWPCSPEEIQEVRKSVLKEKWDPGKQTV